ncbi:MAG: magnesium transporter CorA family protein [Ignavibacteriales bacterium]|nr:magnesium transporter CorA family protein [Ignavibacteriales bacterium]
MKIENKNYIFFLGGHDAEMREIKNILTQHNFTFYDKELLWDSAKASGYKNEIENLKGNEIPVLIELTVDIELPSNTIIIDHHNEKENNKSSIEQIAELLGIELNRWQKLIAANDKGYIPAMECMCATKDEIRRVREADRKAQGVTEKDEKLADESIEKNKTIENGITVIKSKTDKFSAVTDRMYGETNRLLIYTNKELSFYGNGKKRLTEKYKNYIKEGKAYYGGSDYGFFGFGKGWFSDKEIEGFKHEIVKMDFKDDIPISHHIFLFPFKWDLKCENKSIVETSFKNRTNLEEIFNIINDKNNFDEGISWVDFDFKINRPRDYNEYTYFYEYVTAVLFDSDKDNAKTDWNTKVVLQYNLNLEKNESKYLINILEREPSGKPKIPAITYELIIEDIIINFYQTGVGILSFHLSNYEHNKPEEILDINDFGRRIYPQFLSESDPKNPLKNVKETFLANCITLQLKPPKYNSSIESDDCFSKYCCEFENKEPKEISKLPEFITKLLGNKFKDTEYGLKKGEVKLAPVIDDRMFTICWYGNDNCSNLLKEKQWVKELNRFEYNYERNELWNRFIFIDNRSNGLANNNFLRDLNIEHTYNRWVDLGNFFGISRYSFILLTNRDFFPKYILLQHLQTMYFQLVMLALLQRASLIRFSDEATKVRYLESTKDEIGLEDQLEYVKQLHGKYLHFVNKIFFREPTAQEQGIELYDMLLEKMRIEREVKDLDRELNELHNYISLTVQERENKEIRILSKLATFFLPATLIAGILGMNTLPEPSEIPTWLFNGAIHWPFLMSLILMFLFTLITFGIFYLIRKKKNP